MGNNQSGEEQQQAAEQNLDKSPEGKEAPTTQGGGDSVVKNDESDTAKVDNDKGEEQATILASSVADHSKVDGGTTPPLVSQAEHPQRRRIIKATTPVPAQKTREVAPVTESANVPEKNDNKDHGAVMVPAVAREIQNESMDQYRKERTEKVLAGQKEKRAQAVDERRKNPVEPKETPQANPMSQFLSAFSVEPKFPAHKRSYEEGDSSDSNGPNGKKTRTGEPTSASDSEDDKEVEKDLVPDSSGAPIKPSRLTTIVSLAAIIVVTAFVTYRRKK